MFGKAKVFGGVATEDHLDCGRHELPAALELRPALPRAAVGKLSKKELRDEARGR